MGRGVKWVMFYILMLCMGCSEHGELTKKEKKPVALSDYAGTFASDGYEHRSKGFDYLSVQISPINDTLAQVSVRSRADNKKPTCSFDSQAVFLASTGELEAEFEGKSIHFDLDEDTLSISAPDDDDHMILYFLAPGGSALMGNYYRVKNGLTHI